MILKKYTHQLKELIEGKNVILCPKCDRYGLQWDGWQWYCLWKDCRFHTVEIPTKRYVQGLLDLEQQFEDLKKLQNIRKIPYKFKKKFDNFRKLIERKK